MIHQKKNLLFATGFVFFILAAIIFISIFSAFISLGRSGTAQNAFLYLGAALSSSYGGSSLLIPVFLVVAGLMCFSPNWTFKRGFYLLGSLFPFYTIVLTEKLCRGLIDGMHPIYVIFAVVLTIISAMLIVLEYFALNILANIVESIVSNPAEFTPPVSFRKQMKASASPDADLSDDTFVPEKTYSCDTVSEDDICNDFDIDFPIDESDFMRVESELESLEDVELTESENIIEEDEPLVSEVMAAALKPSEPTLVDDLLAAQSYEENVSDAETEHTESDDCLPIENEPVTVVFQVPELYVPDTDEEMGFVDSAQDDKNDEFIDGNISEPVSNELYSSAEADFLSDPFADEHESVCDEDDDTLSDEQDDDYVDEAGFIVDSIVPEKEPAEIVVEKPEEVSEKQCIQEDLTPVVYKDEEQAVIESPSVHQPVLTKPPIHQKEYKIPVDGLLTSYPDGAYWVIDEATKAAAVQLKETLSEFKIEAEVTGISKGPVITMFEILPAPGVKLNKIAALQDNIALRLAASSVRIVAPIPGKHAVGIEIPNKERSLVSFKEIIELDSPSFKKMAVPVILGKDITGNAQIIDLTTTPHLLIAGATGAGKSVCVNSLILSILYKRAPTEVKLILIDPKIVELKLYNDIPHLLTPVITEPKRAYQSLQYCLCEMERRYALLDGLGVRDIKSYNRRISERHIAAESLPYIVVIIDEFADLMATTGKELETTVARLAAMSRAVGIHLVLATQRPSIDVITGLIKANIPSRIAFMVASKTDSRIILDQVGAEKLLGKGDMLYVSSTAPFPIRIQGTFISDQEVENVVDCVKEYGAPDYIDDEIFVDDEDDSEIESTLFGEGSDPLYDKALEIVIQAGKASASYIQRRLKIGYNRAARLVEEMEDRGIVGPANGSKPREIIHMP